MAKRRKSNRRRRRGSFGFLYKLLSTLAICAVVVAALTLFFRVDTIEVTGMERYTAQEVIDASGVASGDNLFLLNKYSVDQDIKTALPYIEELRINRRLPDTLVIQVQECGTPLAVVQDGSAWLVSPKGKIVGQEEAVKAVSAAIRRSRVQINPRRRPASFIFVGPTGTGKTELVRVLSKELFDSPETLIRLDMSEYMEKHSVSKIIGSPPGYVGYDEAGQLTEKVRRRPYSVLLFDEIEKAHPDVMNILLQILDEGRITDAHGRTVNFENTVIVMTSNAGSNSREALVGFNRTSADISREKAMRALSDFLRPEFLSRIDEIVVFRPLNEEDYKKIAVLMLNEYVGTLNERGITLRWTDEAVANIAHRAAGGKSGARDIRNTIRRTVEDKIACLIVEKGEGNVTGILVTEKDGEIDVESI